MLSVKVDEDLSLGLVHQIYCPIHTNNRMIVKPKILVIAAVPMKGLAALAQKCDLIYPTKDFMFSDEEVLMHLQEVDGALAVFTKPMNAQMLAVAKNLRIIANFGVGYNNIDVAKATEMGIVVCNTPNAVTEPTAEMAFGLLLAVARNIAFTDRGLRANSDFKWGMMENLGTGTYGKTLGIIGMGRIGQAFARRAFAFGMNIIYYNRTRLVDEIEQKFACRYVGLEELLERSDVISLHCPLSADTFHLIDEQAILRMKTGVILLNTARGPVVDEKALVKFLQNGKLGGAGLDVFEDEPFVTPGLLMLDNVVLTPHNATGTIETRIETAREAAANILGYFEGSRNISVVNPQVWL